MHRIDTKTAQKDKFGAGKNGFTRGNPQTGTPATDLDDDYFDMLQEELCSVVEASGASLEKGRHDQLLTALRALLLSRKNPFGDIKSDGTVQTALENLGLRETVNKAADALPSGGTAVAANRLATPRNINGVPFDGTLDINITSGMTQSTADGRYVQNVQLGAQSYHSPGGNEMSWNYSAPSGCMLSGINVQETGSRSADNIGGVYYRPVQIYINNAWRTVSSV
ncbi:hypothetical protein GHS85_RS14445 [Escherichia coli]|uniref:hypothetical protein n=2 Tax=Escherichia coli TaxID=562 RepID=UPI00203C4ACE|nr:hypothetical protein [Escherichia coli]